MHPFCCASPIPVSPAAANHHHSFSSPAPLEPMSPPPPPPARSRSLSANASASLSLRASFRDALLPTHHEISGILYKWVNYGKGWRPRWFVLQDGVLSYYKIHGPDRIDLNPETEKGSLVIGEESHKRINRGKSNDHGHGHGHNHSHGNGLSPLHARKAIGEVHLKVCAFLLPGSYDNNHSLIGSFS